MTVAEAIRAATERLSETSDTARLDAEVLMAHALSVSAAKVRLHRARRQLRERVFSPADEDRRAV